MPRTSEEIKAALAKLERNMSVCVPYSCFGSDNKQLLIVMIDVIKNQRSRVWINSAYLSTSELFHEVPDNAVWRSALDAFEWMENDFEIEELLFKEKQTLPVDLFEEESSK